MRVHDRRLAARPASATSWSCAPAQPAPARIVTRSARVQELGRGRERRRRRAGSTDVAGRIGAGLRAGRRVGEEDSPGIDHHGDAAALERRRASRSPARAAAARGC